MDCFGQSGWHGKDLEDALGTEVNGRCSSSSIRRVMSMKRYLCGLVALVLVLGVTGQAKAQPSYVYTTLPEPPGLTDTTQAYGTNAAGQIVGTYQDYDPRVSGFFGKTRSFLLSNGNYATIDPPDSSSAEAHGIN